MGLVRPERRNIGFYIHSDDSVYASTDGVALVRERPKCKGQYPIEWIFQALRTEACRLQFWTESGGTSYGKLTSDQIKNVLIPLPHLEEIAEIKKGVVGWAKSILEASTKFHSIWDTHDKVAILNSPLIGLEGDDFIDENDDEES